MAMQIFRFTFLLKCLVVSSQLIASSIVEDTTTQNINNTYPQREISFGGRFHRTIMLVDDGFDHSGYFMDSEQTPSVLNIRANQSINNKTSTAGNFEVALQSNRPVSVSQDDPNPGTTVVIRNDEIILNAYQLGKFSLGRGLASAFVASEVDVSGTNQAALISVGALAPGMKFTDKNTNELSSIKVSDYFMNSEQLLFSDRVRFDTKSLFGGLILSGTAAADGRWDSAARYYPSISGWNIRTAITYQSQPYGDVDHQVYFAFSTRQISTGLTLTTALTAGKTSDDRYPRGYLIKTGWKNQISKHGNTAFTIDFSNGIDPLKSGEKTQSVGVFVNQEISKGNLNFYTGYRSYQVSNSGESINPLGTYTFGAIYSF